MKKILAAITAGLICAAAFAGGRSDAEGGKAEKNFKPSYNQQMPEGEPAVFDEVWGWVMTKREDELNPNFPVTDVCYFSAEVDSYGALCNVPDIRKLKNFTGRKHIVIVSDSRSLTHFLLDPSYKLVDRFIKDIMKAAKPYDGVQIDFELIPGKDGKNFLNFLTKLSQECKDAGKMFTVCVPARIKTISDDIFPYKKIAEISDRVIIMAYDEHWSTSKPGPIASVAWCEKIVDYAKTVIPQEKLVMGLPFYGRTWASEKPASSWYFTGVNRLMREYDAKKVKYVDDIPTTNITIKVKTEAWWEDCYSTVKKMRLYEQKDVKSIAFWRIGQEDPLIWNWIIPRVHIVEPEIPDEMQIQESVSSEEVDHVDIEYAAE